MTDSDDNPYKNPYEEENKQDHPASTPSTPQEPIPDLDNPYAEDAPLVIDDFSQDLPELSLDEDPIPPSEYIQEEETLRSRFSQESLLSLSSLYGMEPYEEILILDEPEPKLPLPDYATRDLNLKKTNHRLINFYQKYLTHDAVHHLQINNAQAECRLNTNAVFHGYAPILTAYFVEVVINKTTYITCQIPKELINLVINPITDPLSVHELGNDVLASLLEITFAVKIEELERATGVKIEFRFIDNFPIEENAKIQYFISHQSNGMTYPVNIYASEPFLQDFLDKLYMGASPKKHIDASIQLSMVSAIKQIPYKKIKSIRPGEIIILMTNRHLINQPLGIIGQRLVVGLNFLGNQVEITSEPQMIDTIPELCMNYGETPDNSDFQQEEYTSASAQNSIADNVAASMTDMRVPVTFELGRMDLPVNFLSKVTVGQIVDLNKPLDENISVLVNGKVVALGEVVQVGHNFGVIIKEVI